MNKRITVWTAYCLVCAGIFVYGMIELAEALQWLMPW